MQHFDIARWTDYVHGLVPLPERAQMDRHVREGCHSCRRLADLVARIQTEIAAEPAVPEALVRRAQAIFPAGESAREASDWLRLPRLAAQLIFDSLALPCPEGARAAAAAEAHKIYHAGDYAIDLQIEHAPESDEMALVGQLADRSASGHPVSGVSVLLTARSRVLARAESNRFGEFCLVGRSVQGLTLRVPLAGDGKQVVIPLTGMVEEG